MHLAPAKSQVPENHKILMEIEINYDRKKSLINVSGNKRIKTNLGLGLLF